MSAAANKFHCLGCFCGLRSTMAYDCSFNVIIFCVVFASRDSKKWYCLPVCWFVLLNQQNAVSTIVLQLLEVHI